MKPKMLLRIAAIVMVLHLAGHLFGHLTWKTPPTPEQQEVVKEMTTHKFPFMGAVHSMGDYYEDTAGSRLWRWCSLQPCFGYSQPG
jgi:hypothetical protein